ncbi:MAG: sugar kinase [Dehalococcoidia bacterium]|nr:sugar kinase [Dehalococcoidia bacterium]MCB9486193.1 sugar kinase [Thermoflexaceae bacterium]
MSLLVSGWIAVDEIETPFGATGASLGGSATFTLFAGALFTDVRLLAAVGPDFPASMRAQLAHPRIDISGLTTEDGTTSRWGAKYGYDLNTREDLYTHVGVNETWQPEVPAAWRDTRSAVLSAAHPYVQRELSGQLTAKRATIMDTIRFYIANWPREILEVLGEATFVTMNDGEARELTGEASIAKATRNLLERGANAVIIKLGEYGAVYATKDEYFVAPGYPLEEVIDPTGAGDAFAGAFMGYLDSVEEITAVEIRRGILYGSTVASFCVEGLGPTRLFTLTRDEVEKRYRTFRALTRVEVDG